MHEQIGAITNGSYAAQPQHNDSYIIKSVKEHDLIIGS